MNTFIRFEGISNALVDVRPTASRLFAAEDSAEQLSGGGGGGTTRRLPANRHHQLLDTSFALHATLGNALEQLLGGSGSPGRHTPTLGESRICHAPLLNPPSIPLVVSNWSSRAKNRTRLSSGCGRWPFAFDRVAGRPER